MFDIEYKDACRNFIKCSGTYYSTAVLFDPTFIKPRYYLTPVLYNIKPRHTIIITAVAKISSRGRLLKEWVTKIASHPRFTILCPATHWPFD